MDNDEQDYEYDFAGEIESNNEYNYFRLFLVMKSYIFLQKNQMNII